MSRVLAVALSVVFLSASILLGQGRVYVTLWFDTEDYIEPASDDAALRIARDLDQLGVKATFKVVAEKARVLEKRGRKDVIEALARHDIGYHTQFHSIPPAPAVYLEEMGYLEGAAEFLRREAGGVADIRRIFGIEPSCYGQPGSSWGPQTNVALREMGIRLYLDEGSQVGLNGRPFWYGGILYVFNMGPNSLRASLDPDDLIENAFREFDKAAAALARQGGGVISIYYHPCEFVTTEFWDGVNFSRGANPPRSSWKEPRKRTPEDSERCYQVLNQLVRHIQANRQSRFVTGRQLIELYPADGDRKAAIPARSQIAAHLAARQTFLENGGTSLSAAEMLLILLGLKPDFVEGPLTSAKSTYQEPTIPAEVFGQAKDDVIAYIKRHRRLPSMVWLGSQYLSIEDFAATLAADAAPASAGGGVGVRRGNAEFEKYFATDPRGSFGWVIHPEGFSGDNLLALGRLQGWTLKPAKLRAK